MLLFGGLVGFFYFAFWFRFLKAQGFRIPKRLLFFLLDKFSGSQVALKFEALREAQGIIDIAYVLGKPVRRLTSVSEGKHASCKYLNMNIVICENVLLSAIKGKSC